MSHFKVVQTTQNHYLSLKQYSQWQGKVTLHLLPGPLVILLNNGILLVNVTILFLWVVRFPSLVGEFPMFIFI